MVIFRLNFEKTIVIFEISTLDFVKMLKFMQNKKKTTTNLRPKMPYLGNFELLVWKAFVIFEVSTIEFVKIYEMTTVIFEISTFKFLRSFLCKNENSYIWEQKCIMWVFLSCNFKGYCHIWNQHSLIGQIENFRAKNEKILKLVTKNVQKIIWNQHPLICQKWFFN